MSFQSLDFLVFIIGIFTVYWWLPRHLQNVLLIAASIFFYGYIHPWFLIPLLVSCGVDYLVAIGMERWPRRKGGLLAASMTVNLGMLAVFKYHHFFIENVRSVLVAAGLSDFTGDLQIVLPVGISFYTFQTLSYTVDVYRGELKAQRNFITFALYVMFFPQLVAGPIERAKRLMLQIGQPRVLTRTAMREGIALMIWGFFKKLVIADNVAILANKVFAMAAPNFPVLWAGVLAFCIQIFADFSAYTDIARGSAKLLGFDLVQNFRHPYLARSPRDFWARWHISLSSWFRDYVYLPLGGSRVGRYRQVVNVLVVFLLSGLWHGAAWNFVLWGLYWGVLVLFDRAGLFRSSQRGTMLVEAAKIASTFVLTNIGWLLFRESNLTQLFSDLALSPLRTAPADWRVAGYIASVAALYSLPLWIHAWIDGKGQKLINSWLDKPFLGRATGLGTSAALLAATVLMRSPVVGDFIYFQF